MVMIWRLVVAAVVGAEVRVALDWAQATRSSKANPRMKDHYKDIRMLVIIAWPPSMIKTLGQAS